MPAFLIRTAVLLGLTLPFSSVCFAQNKPAPSAPAAQTAVPAAALAEAIAKLEALPPAPATAAVKAPSAPKVKAPAPKAKKAPRPPVRKPRTRTERAIETADKPAPTKTQTKAEAAEVIPDKYRDPMSFLVYGSIPERNLEYYAKFIGTSTYEGVQDIKAPRDGQFVLTVSSGDWVVKDDMLGFITSPEMSAIMAATPVGERMTAAQRWKQLYGAEVMKAEKNCLVAVVYRPDRSFVKKGDLLFSLAEDIYVIGESGGAPSEGYSPGMKVMLRQRGEPGAALLPGILQEFFEAQSASDPDPLAEELGENAHKKYFLRVQIPARAAPYMRMGKIYDGYVMMQNVMTGPVVPKRALITRDGKRYLMTLSEVTIDAESDKGVQLQNAPWPGTEYVYPESLGAAAKLAATSKPPVPAKPLVEEKPAVKAEPAKKAASKPAAPVAAPKDVKSVEDIPEIEVNVDSATEGKPSKAAQAAAKRSAKDAPKKKTAPSATKKAEAKQVAKVTAKAQALKTEPPLPPGELVEMQPEPPAAPKKSTAAVAAR